MDTNTILIGICLLLLLIICCVKFTEGFKNLPQADTPYALPPNVSPYTCCCLEDIMFPR